MQKKVLFLCTGNSCRSQMAEAIVNAKFNQEWLAYSAGTKPAGYVHPMAIQVLAELEIDHRGRSKLADEFRQVDFDRVITVCDSAAEECPMWLGKGKRLHHSFPDPGLAQGSTEEILEIFRKVRDEIMQKLPVLLSEK